MKPHTYTLALDPSLAETGYALLDTTSHAVLEKGSIPTHKRHSDQDRLNTLATAISKLLTRPCMEDVAIELPFVGNNRRTALTLGAVRGMLLYLATQQHLRVHEYTTSQIKTAVTGVHTATKHQVQAMIQRLTGIRTTNHNESDAIAVGLTHLRYIQFQRKTIDSNST